MRLIDYLDKGASLGSESPSLTMAGRTLNYRDVQEVTWRGAPAVGPGGGRAGGEGGLLLAKKPAALACVLRISPAGGGGGPINPAQGGHADRPEHRNDVGAHLDELSVRGTAGVPGARATHPRGGRALLPDHDARW